METKQTLKKLSDQKLLENFSQIVRFERKATAQVVVHLAEIYDRRLYAREGYSSLFSYIKEKFNYSGSSAYRRIQAARLSLRFPEIVDLLVSGKLNLMAICLIEAHMTAENGKELISQAIGKTKEEIEYQLAQQFPKIEKMEDKLRRLPVIKRVVPVVERPDSGKGHIEGGIFAFAKKETRGNLPGGADPTGGAMETASVTQGISTETHRTSGPRDDSFSAPSVEIGSPETAIPSATVAQESKKNEQTKTIEIRRVKLECVVDEAVAKKLERAKEVLRSKYPKGRLEDILNEALDLLLDKKDPERKIEREKRKVERTGIGIGRNLVVPPSHTTGHTGPYHGGSIMFYVFPYTNLGNPNESKYVGGQTVCIATDRLILQKP